MQDLPLCLERKRNYPRITTLLPLLHLAMCQENMCTSKPLKCQPPHWTQTRSECSYKLVNTVCCALFLSWTPLKSIGSIESDRPVLALNTSKFSFIHLEVFQCSFAFRIEDHVVPDKIYSTIWHWWTTHNYTKWHYTHITLALFCMPLIIYQISMTNSLFYWQLGIHWAVLIYSKIICM